MTTRLAILKLAIALPWAPRCWRRGTRTARSRRTISRVVLVRPYEWRWVVGLAIGHRGDDGAALGCYRALRSGRRSVWGIDVPVMWGFAIVNFVWWIGIGHAGTLISAILLLLKQDWRTSINRFAEAMTLFAVACAGMFPILASGSSRGSSIGFCLIPTPWPCGLNGAARLIWDVFAVSTYATVSLLFWYVGLVPDLATMRDRARNHLGSLCVWNHRAWLARLGPALGSLPHRVSAASPVWQHRLWFRFTPVVALDFTVAIVPGWHSTIFPPFFVAGAIFSGFAMVVTIAVPSPSRLRSCKISSRSSISTTWARSCWRRE